MRRLKIVVRLLLHLAQRGEDFLLLIHGLVEILRPL